MGFDRLTCSPSINEDLAPENKVIGLVEHGDLASFLFVDTSRGCNPGTSKNSSEVDATFGPGTSVDRLPDVEVIVIFKVFR